MIVKPDGSCVCVTLGFGMPEPLYKRRWRLLLEQFGEEYGDKWKSEFARRTGIHSTAINKQLGGQGPSGQTVELLLERFTPRIARDFFYDPSLGESPRYRDHLVGKAAPPSPGAIGAAPDENPHWKRFRARGVIEHLRLTDEQVEWVRNAPFRGGAQSPEDYARAAEVVVRKDLPLDPEFEAAR